jgi:hypothetical protein
MGPPCHYSMDSQADLYMSTPSEYLVSINYWLSLFEKSVIWSITYFIGSYLVICTLYQVICLFDSSRYSISDVKFLGNCKNVIGHVNYAYDILLGFPK